ncbi:MAG: hypothetical protein DRP56_04740 [Planctomycetota bacterium]|nr:MAG: hypothetical protein DRP56_04740 [Planctomycetota bacterium]
MKPINAAQLAEIIGGELIAGDGVSFFNGVSIDSRTIGPGQVFFAITGENFDGHDYAEAAIEKGAACMVVQREVDAPTKTPAIQVDNCITALAQFASWYRRQLSAKVIAITGSVGKTTTRQILHQILSRFFKCRQALGNFNNHLGLPLTILSAEPDDDILLLELGSNHLGEIASLTRIANPDIALITRVAPSHLEGFGSLANIIKEKVSIAHGLRTGGALYVNGDQPDLLSHIRANYDVPLTSFGLAQGCDIVGTDLQTEGAGGSLVIDGQTVRVPLAGRANLMNVLSAWAICRELAISLPDFARAAQQLKSPDLRLQTENIGPLTILNDCYNANPASMANALECLSSMAADTENRKVFIAGSMAELGAQSESLHRQLGQKAASEGVQVLLVAGPFAEQILQGAKLELKGSDPFNLYAFKNTRQLCDNLHKWIKPDDIVLVKGSRSANLEKAIQRLRELFEQ